MSADAGFPEFEKELNRLVESFGHRLAELKKSPSVEPYGLTPKETTLVEGAV
jgi:hypothetical protein